MGESSVPCVSGAGTEFYFLDVHAFLYCSQLFSIFTLFVCSRNSESGATCFVDYYLACFLRRQFADDGIFLLHGISAGHFILDHYGWRMETKDPSCSYSLSTLFRRNSWNNDLAFVLF